MKKFQISKSDPVFKTEDGKYIKDDWNSVSDIDKIFDGQILTIDDYMAMESRYIKIIKRVLGETESSYLKVVGLEKFDDYLDKLDRIPYNKRSDEIYESLEEGKVLPINDTLVLLELMLRENVWCYLTNKYVTIQTGHDYYLYVTLENEPKFFNTLEDDHGLFLKRI